ncbi:MAG: ABC-F family ATP-binding cassette domain-containing protein [Bacteroidota bacterium]
MIVLNNISFEFGSRYLYKDTSWHIKPKQKIGLIGANGTGKSTLLRIIVGEYSIEGGEITRRKDCKIGFLNQDLLSYQSDDDILTVACEAFERENQLHKEIDEILIRMEHDHSDEIMHQLHDKQHEFDVLDGYNIKNKAEKVLEGLGFLTSDLTRPLKEFSGGWRMRVMLAKILLQKPDLLLLDEPTNHLDLPSIKWIEDYLVNYDGAVIVVSHDRYFLDKICDRIVEVANQKLTTYVGNYSHYRIEKVEREELQKNQFANQQAYIKEQEQLINRFRAKASKAKMAQSRIKQLEKLERIDDVESDNASIKFSFKFTKNPGKTIIELKNISKAYPDIEILKDAEATILRGDKIALIGANGKGKSTLLRIIDGSEEFTGHRELGYNVTKTFYAQHQLEALNIENNLMEELIDLTPGQNETTLRTLLGSFLFHGDDVFKKIKVLSGGEKSRVALAKSLLMDSNFLLLDEPTNHLDMQSVNMLIQVMNKFEGTFIVVSHDRFFLSSIANKIWFIEDKKIKEYPGTYDEFEEWDAKRKQKPVEVKKAPVQVLEPAKNNNHKAIDKQKDMEQKKKLQTLAKNVKKHEEKLAELEAEKARIEAELAKPDVYADVTKRKELMEKYHATEKMFVEQTKTWELAFNELIELEAV